MGPSEMLCCPMHHLQKCKKFHAPTIHTHDAVVNVVAALAKHLGAVTVEPREEYVYGLEKVQGEVDGNNKRLDIKVARSGGEKVIGLDIQITNPVKKKMVAKSARLQGVATVSAAKQKERHHGESCKLNNIEFIPFIIETGGRLGFFAHRFIEKALYASSEKQGIPINNLRLYWMKRLSTAVQRGISLQIVTRYNMLRKGKKHKKEGLLDEGDCRIKVADVAGDGIIW